MDQGAGAKKLNKYLRFNKTSLNARLKLYLFMKSISLLHCIAWKSGVTIEKLELSQEFAAGKGKETQD